jgi:hypothetical protein
LRLSSPATLTIHTLFISASSPMGSLSINSFAELI